PMPWRRYRMPASTSSSTARRTVMRLTPKRSVSCASESGISLARGLAWIISSIPACTCLYSGAPSSDLTRSHGYTQACYNIMSNARMKKEVVHTNKAAVTGAPLVQAVKLGNLVFCSGASPRDPKQGNRVIEGEFRAQATQALANLKAVLEAAGSGFDHCL